MAIPEIEEFGKALVQHVRDAAIHHADHILESSLKEGSSAGEGWRKAMQGATPESFAKYIIPEIVDDTLATLLDAMDNGFQLSFTASNGRTVSLTFAGEGRAELLGWYLGCGDGGWVAQYSKERFTVDASAEQ